MRSHLATVRWEIGKSRDSGYPRGHLKLRGSRGRGVGERASRCLSNAVEGVTAMFIAAESLRLPRPHA